MSRKDRKKLKKKIFQTHLIPNVKNCAQDKANYLLKNVDDKSY